MSKSKGTLVVEFTIEEIEMLSHALDSHVAWMKGDNDGPPADDDPLVDIEAARALQDDLVELLQVREAVK